MIQQTVRSRTKIKDVRIADIGINTQVLRSRTWDKLKLEVEYMQNRGTTSNSYLIKGDKVALIDPPGQSFTHIYLEILSNHEWGKIDYIILQHVNPNRLATIKLIAGYAPQAQIICSQPAANALRGALMFPAWKSRVVVVKDKDTLDLGQGHKLQFISATTTRWLDGLCTYDSRSKILFTDKLFGTHLCGDSVFDDSSQQLDWEHHFYFDCLHASQTKQLTTILTKIKALEAEIYAPAHGFLTKHSLSQLMDNYCFWCKAQNHRPSKVALLHVSAYGNTSKMSNAIALGLVQSGIAVESINCESTSTAKIINTIQASDGFIIGLPTLNGQISRQLQATLDVILANIDRSKLVGLFGYDAWSGQALSVLESKLKNANYKFGFKPLRAEFGFDQTALQECIEAGKKFGQKLQKSEKLHVIRPAKNRYQASTTVDKAV
ncbi:MAG: FprA family A-type flavoprotein [Cyanobacteria bacterium P01_G01_bin.19]